MNDRPLFEVEPTINVDIDDFIDTTTNEFDRNDMVVIRAFAVSFDLLRLKYVSTVDTQVRITFTNSPVVVANVSTGDL